MTVQIPAGADVAATAAAIASLAESTSPETAEQAEQNQDEPTADETTDSEEEQTDEQSESDDATDEGNAEEESAETKPAKGRSPKLDKLIASKGGDEDAFAENIYETMNSAARLAKENAELKARVQKQDEAKDEAAAQEEVAEDPDVASLRQDVASVTADIKTGSSKQNDILKALGKLELAIATKQGEHKVSDAYQQGVIAAEIAELKRAQASLDAQWDQLERDKPRLERQKREAERLLRQAERQVSQTAAQRQKALQDAERAAGDFRSHFEGLVEKRILEFGIPKESLAFVTRIVKSEAMNFLRSPEGAAGFKNSGETAKFIDFVLKGYADDRGLVKKTQFTDKSKLKLAAAGKTAAPPAKAPAGLSRFTDKQLAGITSKPAPRQEKNADYWSKRADQILEAR